MRSLFITINSATLAGLERCPDNCVENITNGQRLDANWPLTGAKKP
jgi:hypothetical protein